MSRTKVVIGSDGSQVVELTAEENSQRDAEEAQWLVDKPMNNWKASMQGTDSGMPRYLEDHIKDDHDGVASNEFLQAKFDEKKR